MRFNLTAKIALACLILICAPALLAWAMGVYDQLVARDIETQLDDAARGVAGADVDDTAWLHGFAVERGMYAVVLDEDGQPLHHTEASVAEGRLWDTGWMQRAADFFFGPHGPPDLAAFEGTLGPVAARDEVVRARASGHVTSAMRTSPDSTMQVFYRVVPSGTRTVYLAKMTRRSARALYDFRFQMLKLTIALFVAAVAMAAWLGWSVVGPVRRLQARVRSHLVAGSATQLAMARADEIGDLSRDFDALAGKLQERLEHTAQMTADFAHDLKNPLASLTAAAELLEGEVDAERRARVGRVIGDAAAHMERSVDAMLALARLDEELPRQKRSEVNMGALVERVADDVELDLPEEVMVWGVEERLEELVRNLVDNARVFARSRIRVSVRAGERVVIEVEDDGPGVSEGNRDKVFRRFFTLRPEGAERGSGLGLAIARTIAAAHGGEVDLADEGELGGACFRVTLPAAT